VTFLLNNASPRSFNIFLSSRATLVVLCVSLMINARVILLCLDTRWVSTPLILGISALVTLIHPELKVEQVGDTHRSFIAALLIVMGKEQETTILINQNYNLMSFIDNAQVCLLTLLNTK